MIKGRRKALRKGGLMLLMTNATKIKSGKFYLKGKDYLKYDLGEIIIKQTRGPK